MQTGAAAEEPGVEHASETKFAYHYFLRPELFQWEEFWDSGARILKEKGTRIRGGVNAGSQNWNFDFSLFFGAVDYDGVNSVGVPVQTVSQYAGMTSSVLSKIRLDQALKRSTDVVFGVVSDIWSREIVSTSAGKGYIEDYFIFAIKGGAKLTFTDHLSVELGLRYPFYTKEYVGQMNLTLTPSPAVGYYGILDVSKSVPFHQRAIGIAATFDVINFNKSPLSSQGVYQPTSKMQLIGIQVSF